MFDPLEGYDLDMLHRLRDLLRERRSTDGTVDRTLEDELDRLSPYAGRLAGPNLATERFELVVDVRADPVAAAVAFSEAITRLGRLLESDLRGPEVTLSGVVGSGFLNMNPAVVEVRINPNSVGGSRATLSGTAKEGAINQGSAQKAVRQIFGC